MPNPYLPDGSLAVASSASPNVNIVSSIPLPIVPTVPIPVVPPVIVATDVEPVEASVVNFPATQPVSGSVAVSNFPVTQPVSGSVSVTGTVAVSNFPGTVAVSNFPGTQPVSGSVSVSNFPATQPVSAAALPLPAGASTEATLSALNAKVTAVNTGAVTISAALPAGANALGSVSVSNFPATQPISAVSLPLPTGASQEHSTAASPESARLSDGAAFYKATTPADTQPISAASLPLPTGAATQATLATIQTQTSQNAGKTVNRFVLNQGAAGNTVIAAASVGNKHKVVGFLISAAANGTLTWFSAAVAITGPVDIAARADILNPSAVLFPLLETAVNSSLNITSATTAVHGVILYLTEP
jgi:hypothetical protein